MLNEAGKRLAAIIERNLSTRIILAPHSRTTEEINQETDALPTPPDWFRANVISDTTDILRHYTDHTEEEILAIQALEMERHRKSDYQRGLKKAGSPEKLKTLQEEADARWEVEHAAWIASNSNNPEWCALMGLPAPSNTSNQLTQD